MSADYSRRTLANLELAFHHSFQKSLNVLFRRFGAVVTPLTIPNREVKHRSGDGTAMRESSLSPEQSIQKTEIKHHPFRVVFFVVQLLGTVDVIYR